MAIDQDEPKLRFAGVYIHLRVKTKLRNKRAAFYYPHIKIVFESYVDMTLDGPDKQPYKLGRGSRKCLLEVGGLKPAFVVTYGWQQSLLASFVIHSYLLRDCTIRNNAIIKTFLQVRGYICSVGWTYLTIGRQFEAEKISHCHDHREYSIQMDGCSVAANLQFLTFWCDNLHSIHTLFLTNALFDFVFPFLRH